MCVYVFGYMCMYAHVGVCERERETEALGHHRMAFFSCRVELSVKLVASARRGNVEMESGVEEREGRWSRI